MRSSKNIGHEILSLEGQLNRWQGNIDRGVRRLVDLHCAYSTARFKEEAEKMQMSPKQFVEVHETTPFPDANGRS